MKINRPEDGDYRYKTKFLWFPKRFDGGWYWLETVTIRQIYFYYGLIPGWYNVCLSNPESGLPISIDPIKKNTMNNIDKPKRPLTRLITEGTSGTCPICKSTEIKRFIFFGRSIGCIQPECERYYIK